MIAVQYVASEKAGRCRRIISRDDHRWEHLLKQLTPLTVYRLPTKENKIPFSVYIYNTSVQKIKL
jgi:hypothetical protein